MSNNEVFAEEQVGQKIDRCFSDAVIKLGKFELNKIYVKNKFMI